MAKAGTKKKVQAIAKVAAKEKAAAMARKRERLDELLALIERRKERIVEDFYDIGEALKELAERELYRGRDYASFDAMLAAHDLMTPQQARKLIAVVTSVP
ncbi:MAG TPA: hypothetical protein VL400_09145, partial [Polyangiaceae bacterium]|nr:hypothetical protein [Polyangiaceae bacterium]